MDLNFKADVGKVDYSVVTPDGQVTIYFKPHKHGSKNIEDLPESIQAAWKLAFGYTAVEIAEELEEGSTGDLTGQDLEDEIQEAADDRIAKKEAEEAAAEAAKDPVPE